MNKIVILLCVLISILSCKTPEARKPETVKTGSFIEESALRNKQLYEAEKETIQAYMATKDSITFIASESGFWYTKDTIISDISQQTPNFGDVVNFDFSLSTLNESPIYTSAELKNRNYAMDQEELFTGLREGLKLMRAGETFTFIFPSQKAYGYYGDENKIGSNTPLISTVTINSITQNN
ncbi:gliding motility-associated peptidyl-prolyl isomerase GldI [Lacinutrix chionoecetis]